MKRTITLLCALWLTIIGVEAKITLSPLFSEGMVLQQESATMLWGYSDQTSVEITSSWGATATAQVDKSGYWSTTLLTPKGSFQREYLILNDKEEELTLREVLIGEVWICSGQSNMYMTLRGYNGQPVQGAFEAALASSQQSGRIRMITLEKEAAYTPQRSFKSKGWLSPSPETVWQMSALAYHYAVALSQELKLPVGIISTSWGGSAIEAWMHPEDLRTMGYDVEGINADPKIEVRRQCSTLYNGLIAPIEGYTAKGFLWYQGESNRHTADRYAEQMERMVASWRQAWPMGEKMPFYYVQIAPYSYNDSDGIDAPLLVEAQIEALKRIPKAGMVSTTDLGQERCIHPARKEILALRLAALALKESYGRNLPKEMCYPMQIDEVVYSEGKAHVKLRNARWGLTPELEPILGFELAGEDGRFYPAEAEIVRSKGEVIVHCNEVPHPTALRYAFRNYTPTNLSNTLGQPLLPYRSDK